MTITQQGKTEMLEQLISLWRAYQARRLTVPQLSLEARSWMDQHCLDADDFAFSLGCALRDLVNHLEETV
jgi:hypothetical protein